MLEVDGKRQVRACIRHSSIMRSRLEKEGHAVAVLHTLMEQGRKADT
jgi:hypothetical protein